MFILLSTTFSDPPSCSVWFLIGTLFLQILSIHSTKMGSTHPCCLQIFTATNTFRINHLVKTTLQICTTVSWGHMPRSRTARPQSQQTLAFPEECQLAFKSTYTNPSSQQCICVFTFLVGTDIHSVLIFV